MIYMYRSSGFARRQLRRNVAVRAWHAGGVQGAAASYSLSIERSRPAHEAASSSWHSVKPCGKYVSCPNFRGGRAVRWARCPCGGVPNVGPMPPDR